MKNIIEKVQEKKKVEQNGKLITRKEAIKRTSYIAFSAATMMILLSNPNKANAAIASAVPPPAW